MADPFSGFLQGLLTSREYQMQKARQIADQTFRDAQLQIDRDTLKQRQAEEIARAKQREFDNDLATRKQDDNLMFDFMKVQQDQDQFNETQKRYEAERKSREQVEKQREEGRTAAIQMRDRNRALISWVQAGGDPYAFDTVWQAAQQGQAAQPAPAPVVSTNVMQPKVASPLDAILGMGKPDVPAPIMNPATAIPPGWQAKIDSTQASALSRAAYAEKMRMEVAHKQQEYALEDALASATLEGKRLQNDSLKKMDPINRALREAQAKNIESQIKMRAQEIALKERNAQWEHNFKQANADEKKRLVGGNIDAVRTKMQSASSAMRSTQKERDAILEEAKRIMADIRAGQDFSDIKGGQIGGPERGSYYYRLLHKASELEPVVRGAKANYYHYQKILEETGNLTYVDEKPKPPAIASSPRAGAKGLAKVTPPPGARPNRYQPTAEEQARKARAGTRFVKPGTKPETDAEIMARLRRKYGN